MHWSIASIMPIPFQWRLLNCPCVGTLHDDFCLKDFCFTSIVLEPAANSCFHDEERHFLTDGKNYKYHVHWSDIHCLNEILQLLWRYICIQFELVEVARSFLLCPGNESRSISATQVQIFAQAVIYPFVDNAWNWELFLFVVCPCTAMCCNCIVCLSTWRLVSFSLMLMIYCLQFHLWAIFHENCQAINNKFAELQTKVFVTCQDCIATYV